MGSCNSATRMTETAGGLVGGALIIAAGVATGQAEIVAAGAGVSALGVGASKEQPGCDKSKQGLIDSMNTIISTAITQTVSECFSETKLEQNIEITCDPKVVQDKLPDITVYEENPACLACMESILQDANTQDDMERIMWNSSPATVRQPINTMYAKMIGGIEECGLGYCKACVMTNVTQQNIVSASEGCISTFMTQASVQANVSTILQQQFLNNQDVMSGAMQTLGIQGVKELSDHISSNIATVVNTSFLQAVHQSISQSQIITIKSATTTRLSHVTQSSILNITQQLVTQNHVATSTYAESVYAQIAAITNQQNTLDELGNVVFSSTTTFTAAIDSAVGMVMMAVLALLGVVVVAIIGFILYKRFKRGVELVGTLNRSKELEQKSWT